MNPITWLQYWPVYSLRTWKHGCDLHSFQNLRRTHRKSPFFLGNHSSRKALNIKDNETLNYGQNGNLIHTGPQVHVMFCLWCQFAWISIWQAPLRTDALALFRICLAIKTGPERTETEVNNSHFVLVTTASTQPVEQGLGSCNKSEEAGTVSCLSVWFITELASQMASELPDRFKNVSNVWLSFPTKSSSRHSWYF